MPEYRTSVQQWRLQPENKCYIQNKHNYVFFCFKRNRIQKRFTKLTDKKVIDSLQRTYFSGDYEGEHTHPLLCGSLTGLETIRMRRVQKTVFCMQEPF
jgi:hypothetical protein